VNIHEAKTHFSKLIADVENGREVVISRAGKPVARLVQVERPVLRTPGGWEGQVWIADDFDEVDDEIVAMFEGKYEA
jgi:prevent-host-death family protein